MTIWPIVEGDGEIGSVPILLRRLAQQAGLYELLVGKPMKRHRTDLAREGPLRNAVRVARLKPDCSAILILFDSDSECPADLGPQVQAWARDEARGVPCAVVLPKSEFEAWFLASIESLRGQRGIRQEAASHPDPETPRGAKQQVRARMSRSGTYKSTVDQPKLTAQFDMAFAYARCRSFRRMIDAFGSLAVGMGHPIAVWPPEGWEGVATE
ncbi:MAG TPA: DUF4276 family protein [Pirellulales bacterium]|nr:DUF4276 family protein [Pirellulales bacterium]